jgi:cyclic beta-1,2-glucan synthetase
LNNSDQRGQASWQIAAPFVALWIMSPLIALWSSRPPSQDGHLVITDVDEATLRMVARRTWRYFETFITAEDHSLPPDNFQEDPEPVVARRTSPTNIGLYMLSIIAAHDFGWIGTHELVGRLEDLLASLDRLERFRGHFYNWYDTGDLRALEPKYISSVDSGNLAGHLLALNNACLEIVDQCVTNPNWIAGLIDTLNMVRNTVHPAPGIQNTTQTHAKLIEAIDDFAATLREPPTSPVGIAARLDAMATLALPLIRCAQKWSQERDGIADGEVFIWAKALQRTVLAHRADLEALMPWANMLDLTADGATLSYLAIMPSIATLGQHCVRITNALCRQRSSVPGNFAAITGALATSNDAAQSIISRLISIATASRKLVDEMEFGFLFSLDRQLLSIGYRRSDESLDTNYYDLLASEARLASFVAIAKGDLPAKHWFRLGRTLTPIHNGSGLISWSGSMFEYLMPSLVMRAPAGSLLEQTNRLIVWRQEHYGAELGVPWGMSESEYNVRDNEKTFQYSSFGIPDLAYKRGLGESIVIAPYASGLAAMIDPAAAARNFRRIADLGAIGLYGWYEAIDYTPVRLPKGNRLAIIRAFMAHHQGMTLVGIANALHGGRMRARFHAEPIVRATELLLQERMPRDIAVARPPAEPCVTSAHAASLAPTALRHFTGVHSRVPRTNLLSNGRYSTMVTAVGSGYSRWRDIMITRWREDPTRDDRGLHVFLRDIGTGETWSAGYQPSLSEPDDYDVTFGEDHVEIIRFDSDLTTTMEIMVSPEDDAEVRRVSITNQGSHPRDIEITSYAEIVLARQADDLAHPAFGALFVQTEFVTGLGAILATRRRRSSADPLVWAAHIAVVEGETTGDMQFETDRARFLGRGQTIRTAAAIVDGWPLSNTAGTTLDTIFSLRRHVRIPRGATARVAFWTLIAETRDAVLALADKHRDATAFERAKTLAWMQAQMQLRHLGISVDEAHLFQRLANPILYADRAFRLRVPVDRDH